mmetsp:Transcript_15197/g.30265  ORF Transcript_15197/g.30265 Transcript_15197/m.30265 type:complete len:214 (-) Transcript_15197:175-816(-)
MARLHELGQKEGALVLEVVVLEGGAHKGLLFDRVGDALDLSGAVCLHDPAAELDPLLVVVALLHAPHRLHEVHEGVVANDGAAEPGVVIHEVRPADLPLDLNLRVPLEAAEELDAGVVDGEGALADLRHHLDVKTRHDDVGAHALLAVSYGLECLHDYLHPPPVQIPPHPLQELRHAHPIPSLHRKVVVGGVEVVGGHVEVVGREPLAKFQLG